jgi:hypothetical protein
MRFGGSNSRCLWIDSCLSQVFDFHDLEKHLRELHNGYNGGGHAGSVRTERGRGAGAAAGARGGGEGGKGCATSVANRTLVAGACGAPFSSAEPSDIYGFHMVRSSARPHTLVA